MGRKKNQPSSIDLLPEPIREEIARLRRANKTIDAIVAHLKGMDVEVSRSAVGRHVKSLAEIGDSLRKSQAMAQFVVEKFGQESDDRVGRASIALLQGAILELLTERPLGEDGEPVTLSAGEAKELSLSIQRLISASSADADRQLKLKREAREEMAREAASAVEKVAKREGGLTAETVQAIKAEILGIRS